MSRSALSRVLKKHPAGLSSVAAQLGLALGLLCLSGCVYNKSDHPDACKKDSDCANNQRCESLFCIAKSGAGSKSDGGASKFDGGNAKSDAGTGGKSDAATMTTMDAGGSTKDGGTGGDAGGDAGERCASGQPPENCYEGPAGTADVGVCKSGQRACIGGAYTQCLGQVLPSDETCNGKDDNCDGKVDEIAMGDCETVMPGACKAGHLMCRGTFAVCEVSNPPIDETCNGLDDDCDSKTDEVASSACYPGNTDGCTVANDGSVTCVGLCHAGMSACKQSKSSCEGAVTPATEACTTTGLAADEDCDSKIDEGCTCTNGQTRACYAGQMGTETHAPCHVGTQQCTNNAWGDCMSQVLPMPPESCANSGVDDDCNGTVDDVPMLGAPCIDDSKKGICRDGTLQCADPSSASPVCVTTQPMHELCDDIDQDCDGDPYDGYDLTSDPLNCGACGNKCDTVNNETCCAGKCVAEKDFGSDINNCGSCGNRCGHSQYCCQGDCLTDPSGGTGGKGGASLPPTGSLCACTPACTDNSCCGTNCVDLTTDEKNCGYCGHTCSSGQVCCQSNCVSSTTICFIRL